MSNYIKFWLRNALYATAILFFGGTVIQTFLMRQGIDSGAVGIYTTLLNAVNVVTAMMFSGIADKNKNIISIISRLMLPVGVCYLGFIPLCLFFTGSPLVTFWTVIILGTIQSFFIALRTVFEYKLPYRIIIIENYGRLAAADGIISGIFGIISSAVLSFMFGRFPFYPVMLCGFIAAAILTFVSALINNTLRVIPEAENNSAQTLTLIDHRSQITYIKQLIRMPVFARLIPSNFLRGLSSGVFSMTAVIALGSGKFSETGTARLVLALSAANLTGSLFFALCSKKIDCRILCLYSSLVMTVFSFILAGNESMFLILYFIVCMAKIIFDYSVPTLLYQIIPYEIAGSYHAWRLILTTAGTALAATLTGYLILYIPAVFLLIFAAVCQVCSGWVYFSTPVLRKN
ncbi:MAG: hypothetical protein ACYCWE_03120 [Eubacteriales bacterium]